MDLNQGPHAYKEGEEVTELVCDEFESENKSSNEPSGELPSAESPQPAVASGTIIGGKYRLENWIGEGGMGTVYKCTAEGFEQPLAIKLLRPEFVDDAISKKRFESEASVASGLSHDNTVSLYDFGVEPDGTPYLVMDFADGENMSDILKREGALSLDRFFNLFSQVCEVLQYAHDRGVIHRDIKPSNIIVTKSGDREIVKLVDFGIAKLLPRGTDVSSFNLTLTGDVFGTPKYMSPEQCQGHKLNHTTDIYSLGCLMYEALAGHPVFEGENAVQIIVKHITEKPKRIFKQGKELAPELQNTILRCLEKDPAKRFKSAGELLATLQKNSKGGSSGSSKAHIKLLSLATAVCLSGLIAWFGFDAYKRSQVVDDSTWRMYQEAGTNSKDAHHSVEAEAMWTSALKEADRIFPYNDMRTAKTCHDLGELKHLEHSDYTGAEQLFQRCFDIRSKNLSPDDRDMADIYGHLGAVKGELGKHDEAITLLDKAIATAEKTDKELSLHYQLLKADELITQRKYDEAENVAKKIVAVRKGEALDENNEKLAFALEKLGYVYAVQDLYDQSIPLYKRAQKIRENGKNTINHHYPWLLQAIASCYRDSGDLTDAKDYFLKSIKAYEAIDDTVELAETYSDLSDTVSRQGNYRLAAQYYERAVELHQTHEEQNPADLGDAIAQAARNSMRLNDTGAAATSLSRLDALLARRGDNALTKVRSELDDIIEMSKKSGDNLVLQTAQKLRNKCR